MFCEVDFSMLFCLPVSYKHASLGVLESLDLQDEDTFLQSLSAEKNAQEYVLLQTCHRVEIYSCLQSYIEITQ
jgi:glutamyl-tRNA reductase